MQRRKKKNLEVERKIKRQKKMYAGVFAAICLVVVMVISWVVWDTQNRRFIMTFAGQRIATSDFLFMSQFMGQPINDFTRHEILDELLTFLVLMERGERYGVGFTAEELEEAEGIGFWTRMEVEMHNPGSLGFISDRRIGEFLTVFETVGLRLVDLLVDYEVDEEEFAEELERQIERQIEENTVILVQYFAAPDRNALNPGVLVLTATDEFDFYAIAEEYCYLQTGREPQELFEFMMQFGVWGDEWDLTTLPVGQFSPTMQGTDYVFIVYIYDRVLPELDIEEITASFRESFISFRSNAVFIEMLLEWVREAEYELNHRVFDTLT